MALAGSLASAAGAGSAASGLMQSSTQQWRLEEPPAAPHASGLSQLAFDPFSAAEAQRWPLSPFNPDTVPNPFGVQSAGASFLWDSERGRGSAGAGSSDAHRVGAAGAESGSFGGGDGGGGGFGFFGADDAGNGSGGGRFSDFVGDAPRETLLSPQYAPTLQQRAVPSSAAQMIAAMATAMPRTASVAYAPFGAGQGRGRGTLWPEAWQPAAWSPPQPPQPPPPQALASLDGGVQWGGAQSLQAPSEAAPAATVAAAMAAAARTAMEENLMWFGLADLLTEDGPAASSARSAGAAKTGSFGRNDGGGGGGFGHGSSSGFGSGCSGGFGSDDGSGGSGIGGGTTGDIGDGGKG
ncbi:unnamed protein product [Phaeothamnion confervicola]